MPCNIKFNNNLQEWKLNLSISFRRVRSLCLNSLTWHPLWVHLRIQWLRTCLNQSNMSKSEWVIDFFCNNSSILNYLFNQTPSLLVTNSSETNFAKLLWIPFELTKHSNKSWKDLIESVSQIDIQIQALNNLSST